MQSVNRFFFLIENLNNLIWLSKEKPFLLSTFLSLISGFLFTSPSTLFNLLLPFKTQNSLFLLALELLCFLLGLCFYSLHSEPEPYLALKTKTFLTRYFSFLYFRFPLHEPINGF
ncbi:hypothetical protein NE237_026077 [Protea cynaroides]|uniref:Uncharacterized protein n=1 Tax=Protea cynaroides TaxID=273540 RepID=A0A9Q0K0U5_9MAGN|nr:hypothetical protein NE237_026077 [Protea cynaroides]